MISKGSTIQRFSEMHSCVALGWLLIFLRALPILSIGQSGGFTLNISRCVFHGGVDGLRFNGTSSNITGPAAVYINVIRSPRNTTANAVGFVTDSVFRELGHENPGFASSFLSKGSIFTNGTWTTGNTTFLANKNAMAMDGGFRVRLVKVKINSTLGKAIVLTLNNAVLSHSNSSSLVISDSEFLSSDISVLAQIRKGLFAFNLCRCVFQGNTKSSISGGNILLLNEHQTVTKAEVFELGHENNGFAWSFWTNDIVFTRGTLRIFNTTFLRNKNAVLVAGGLDAQLVNVKIDSTNGNAILANNVLTVSSTRSSSPVISDPEYLNNSESVSVVVLYNGVFALNISRCIFQGKMGRFNGTSWDKTTMAAVYVKLINQSRESTVQAVGHITDSVFRELGHENNGFALSFRAYNYFSTAGNLTLYNTTFLRNENAISVTCGFDVRLSKVKVHSTYGYAFMANGPQKRKETDADLRVFLELCIFWNNKIGVRMAANICLNDVLFCMASSQSLVVKDSFFIGGNETRGMGDAIRFQVYSDHLYRPPFIKGELILENVTFQELHNSALYVRIQKNVIGQVLVKDCKFVNNSALIERLSEQPTVKIEFDEEDPPKCLNNDKLVWKSRSQIRVIFQDSVIEDNVGISGALNVLNGNVSSIKCTFKNKEGLTMERHIYMTTGFGILHIVNSTFLQTRLNRFSDTKQRGIGSISETLYSPSCREKEKCNDHWFWLATTIYVVFLALYLVFKPAIFSELYRHSLWFKRRTKRFDVQQLRLHNDQNHDPGYLKIIFHFYQVVKLVMVNSPETTLTMVPIIPPVIAIFNFQVKTLNDRIGCPFPGLTAVTKALFQCTTFLGTLLSIGFTYVIHRAASKFRYISAPSLSLYLAVALETLLLGYERLADTSLKLMHCVPIDEEWRLFVDGNIQCWQWWQYLIIAFVLSFIIPLILVLFWGSLLLAKDRLTAEEFLLACAFPLPHLVTWTIRHLRNRDSERVVCSPSDTDEIKKVLYGPFREPSSIQHSTLYWKSVLTGRSLLLLIIHTFATDPIIRFLCLNCACVLILVHHLTMRPFREPKANVFEGLSLLSLVVICSFSLAEATYISEGIDPIEKNQNLFRFLQWIEIVLIGLLPVAACILLIFATLSQVVRLLYHCIRCLLQVIRCKCLIVQLRMPRRLLLNCDQEDAELIV